jgi:hypothetical protein
LESYCRKAIIPRPNVGREGATPRCGGSWLCTKAALVLGLDAMLQFWHVFSIAHRGTRAQLMQHTDCLGSPRFKAASVGFFGPRHGASVKDGCKYFGWNQRLVGMCGGHGESSMHCGVQMLEQFDLVLPVAAKAPSRITHNYRNSFVQTDRGCKAHTTMGCVVQFRPCSLTFLARKHR